MRGLEYVKKVRAKGRVYYYFNTGKLVNGNLVYVKLPDTKAPQFGATYATLLGHRNRGIEIETVDELSLSGLIGLYEKSQKFRNLAPSSQRNYLMYLKRLDNQLKGAPANEITRADITLLMDTIGDKPATANMILRTAGALYAWGRERNHVTIDPTRDIKEFDVGEHDPWPESLIELALASDDARIRLAVALLYFTAQRVGDVCRMQWGDIRDGAIAVTQQKTGREMNIPIHERLTTILSTTPKRGLAIITQTNGTPVGTDAIRKWLQKFAAGHGLKVVTHGLRKNAVNALLEAGCSAAETAAISGQSLQMVEHYAKLRDTTKLGRAAILKWERKNNVA